MFRMTFKPLKYLTIKHQDKKWFDLILPFIFAVIFSIMFFFLNKPFPLITNGGLVPQVNSLLQMLIGFYIAALAAIATFGSENIDELMAGEPPTIRLKVRGKYIETPLTRRRFLCYLFGYLAMMSIFLYLIGVIATLVGFSGSGIIHELDLLGWMVVIKTLMLFFYLFVLINLILTTLLGLYYLSVRIHEAQ